MYIIKGCKYPKHLIMNKGDENNGPVRDRILKADQTLTSLWDVNDDHDLVGHDHYPESMTPE